MAAECSAALARVCSIGGRCVVINGTMGEEAACVCDPGFLPDQTMLHNPTTRDCSRPQSAYLGWLLFQTLVNLVVLYRLAKQIRLAKGLIQQVTFEWMFALFFSWMYVLGLTIQDGLYEVAAVALALLTQSVIRGAFCIIEVFIDARHAIDLKPADMSIMVTRVFMWTSQAIFMASTISMAVTARTENYNYTVYVFLSLICLLEALIVGIILSHVFSLARTLRKMLRESVDGGNLDEKPALLKRLALFKSAFSTITCLLFVPICILITIFNVVGIFPLQWLMTLVAFIFFPLMGMFLQRLNTLIQNFKLEKIMKQSPGVMNGNGVHALLLLVSAPFHAKRRLLSKAHPVQKDRSYFTDLLGWKRGLQMTEFATSRPTKVVITLLSPIMISIGAVEVFRADLLSMTGVILGGAANIGLLLFIFTSLASPRIARHLASHSPMFQFRMLLLTAATLAGAAVLNWTLRSLVLCMLNYVSFVFFFYDVFPKTSIMAYFEVLIFVFTASMPFFVWFMYAFDLLDERRNFTYVTSNYVWSGYHFAVDLHLFIVWCVLTDIIRLIRNGKLNYQYLSCPLPVRILPLGDTPLLSSPEGPSRGSILSASSSSEILSPFSEIDFTEPEFVKRFTNARNSTRSALPVLRKATLLPVRDRQPSIGSPRPGTRLPAAGIVEKGPFFVTGMSIREEDALLCLLIGKSATETVLRYVQSGAFLVNLVCGLMVGAGFGVWAGLVLPGTIPVQISLATAFALCGIPLAFRMGLKSWRVIKFLTLYRFDVVYDGVLAITLFVFIAITLCDFNPTPDLLWRTVPMIPGFVLLFLDWRTSDALVNPLALSPYRLEYFVPVLAGLVSFPSLVFAGRVPVVSVSTFQLVSPHNASRILGDPFLEFDPPKSALARVRMSQLVLDAILVFSVKLSLDALQRWRMRRYSPRTIVLDYLRCSVAPELLDSSGRKRRASKQSQQSSSNNNNHADGQSTGNKRKSSISIFYDPPTYAEDERALIPGISETNISLGPMMMGGGEGPNHSKGEFHNSSIVPINEDEQ